MTIEQLKQKIQIILDLHISFEGPIIEKIIFYYELHTLIKLTQIIEDKMDVTQLTNFLTEHWINFRSTPLSYTALPNNATNELLIEIACYLSPDSPLSVLMPGLALESFHDDYPSLTGNELDISYICQTHIVSPKFNYLIPITLLEHWDLLFPNKSLPNPYYDFQSMDIADALIDKVSIESLIKHSNQTQQLLEASKHYHALCQNQTHMYAKLHQLMQHLLINSSIGGHGSELNAGTEVYSAIINFNQYYQLLEADKKALIPDDVKKEIDTIIELSTNQHVNQSAAENLDTCIYTRRAKLINVVEQHHATLCKIDINESLHPSLIFESQAAFNTQKQQLKLTIANHQYTFGHEKNSITLDLLDKLNLEPQINSFEDLLYLSKLDDKDLENLLIHDHIKSQFLVHLHSLETIVEFSFATSLDKFRLILAVIADDLAFSFNYNAHFFGFWFSLLPEELGKAMLDSFEKTWPEIMNDGNDFAHFLQNMSQSQKKCVVLYFTNKHQLFIKNGDDIALVYRFLEKEERHILFEQLKHHFSELIENGTQLGKVLSLHTPEQQEIIFSAVLSKFPDLIKDSHDFNFCFVNLNQTQKQIIIGILLPYFSSIIRTGADLRLILENLSPDHQLLVWGEQKHHLPKLLISGSDFSEACYYLTENQILELIEKLSLSFVDMITNGADFRDAITFLNDKHKKILFNYCKPHLQKIINSNCDFSQMMQFLDFPQRRECFDLMKNKLFELVERPRDIHQALTYLTASQTTEFLHLCIYKLHSYLDSVTNYNQFSQTLSAENRDILYKEFKLHLQELIISGFDFWSLCESLAYENRINFLMLIKPRLSLIIKTPNDLGQILRCFYVNHQYELGLYLWAHLGQLFKSAEEFLTIMKHLPQTSLAIQFFECYVYDLAKICHGAKDLLLIESQLNESQQQLFFDVIAPRIPKIINHLEDFKYLMQKISYKKYPQLMALIGILADHLIVSEKELSQILDAIPYPNMQYLINHLFPRLPILINNSRNFKLTLNLLPLEKIEQLFEKMYPKLQRMISGATDFSNIICFLSSENKQKIFSATEFRLLDFVHNICQFAIILEHLESHQKKQLLMVHLEKVTSLIHNPQEFSLVMYYLDSPERIILFKQLKQKLISDIEDSNDLGVTLKYLPEDEFINLCQGIKYKLSTFLLTHQDYVNIFYPLNLEQVQFLCRQFEFELLEPIESLDEFEKFLIHFSPEQKPLITELFKYKLSIWLLHSNQVHQVDAWLGTEKAPLSFWLKSNAKLHLLMHSFKLANQQELLMFFTQHTELFFANINQFIEFSESLSPYELKQFLQKADALLPLKKICVNKEEYQLLHQKLDVQLSKFGFFKSKKLEEQSPISLGLERSIT